MKHRAQGYAEYGLIMAGIALLAIVAVFFLGPNVSTMIQGNGKNNGYQYQYSTSYKSQPDVIVVTATPTCCMVHVTPTRSR